MKKLFLAVMSIFLLVITMPVHAEDSQSTTLRYTVSAMVKYVTDNSTIIMSNVNYGDTLIAPEVPVKNGYKFIGWQVEETGELWDFNNVVKEHMTLIAMYEKTTDTLNEKEDSIENTKNENKVNTGLRLNENAYILGVCLALVGAGFVVYKKKDSE